MDCISGNEKWALKAERAHVRERERETVITEKQRQRG